MTRGAKDDPWDHLPLENGDPSLVPGSLIGMVSAELTARRLAGIVRLQVSADMPEPLKTWIAEQRVTDPADILREGFVELIQRERAHCRAGRSCDIRAKMNQLQDPQIIRELYLTSQAGVPITLNVRGLCCLRAVVLE